MPNTFKYHIRKLFTKKQKKPVSTNVQTLHYIFSYSPSAPEALGKPDGLKLPSPVLSFPDPMTMPQMGLKFP